MLKLVLGHIIMVKDLVLSYWTMSRVLEMKLLFLTALTQTTHNVITALMQELTVLLQLVEIVCSAAACYCMFGIILF